jgi:serine/threonine-protein kinase
VQVGDLISGKYRLQRQLGAGSMGSVWAARNELTDRDFAVKFLLPELSSKEDALQRFFHEARACGQIRHPSIVDVYDMGRADNGAPYLVMELLEGEGFDARLKRAGQMRPVDVCRYLAFVARGLEEAHARGLLHRDLKPGNIFFAVDKGGEVHPKVLDFGISKEMTDLDIVATSAGAVLGSPAYMSPEQARGDLDLDARADLWALGVIMYEALTGHLPFDAGNYNALMVKIIREPHVPLAQRNPTVPVELVQVVDRLLEKDRNRRIATAGELADKLERIYVRLTDTPLFAPERQTTLPPHSEQSSELGWQARTLVRGPHRSRVALAGVAVGIAGLAFAGAAILKPKPGLVASNRFGADVSAAMVRARTQVSEAVAHEKARAAEEAAREADRRADEAEKQREVLGTAGSAPRPAGSTTTMKPAGDDPHGGVVGPGF